MSSKKKKPQQSPMGAPNSDKSTSVSTGTARGDEDVHPTKSKTVNVVFQTKSSDSEGELACAVDKILMNSSDLKGLGVRSGGYVLLSQFRHVSTSTSASSGSQESSLSESSLLSKSPQLLCRALPAKACTPGHITLLKVHAANFESASHSSCNYKNRIATITSDLSRLENVNRY